MFLDNVKEFVASRLYGEKEAYSIERLQQILASLEKIELFKTDSGLLTPSVSIRNPSLEYVVNYFRRFPHKEYLDTESGLNIEYTSPRIMRIKSTPRHVMIRFYTDGDRTAYLKGRRGGSALDALSVKVHPVIL